MLLLLVTACISLYLPNSPAAKIEALLPARRLTEKSSSPAVELREGQQSSILGLGHPAWQKGPRLLGPDWVHETIEKTCMRLCSEIWSTHRSHTAVELGHQPCKCTKRLCSNTRHINEMKGLLRNSKLLQPRLGRLPGLSLRCGRPAPVPRSSVASSRGTENVQADAPLHFGGYGRTKQPRCGKARARP